MSTQNMIVIEDNQDDFEALGRGFKEVGLDCSINWYKSSKDALDFFTSLSHQKNKTSIPKLVMLDLNMPGIDGRKILEIIKNTPQLKPIPVVIFTTSADQKDITQCYASGANTYIQKPVKFDDLKKICLLLKEYWFNLAIFANL